MPNYNVHGMILMMSILAGGFDISTACKEKLLLASVSLQHPIDSSATLFDTAPSNNGYLLYFTITRSFKYSKAVLIISNTLLILVEEIFTMGQYSKGVDLTYFNPCYLDNQG
jgi:hypothetical protein